MPSPDPSLVLVLLVSVGVLLAALAALAAWTLRTRRRAAQEVRLLVQALEELRSGRTRAGRPELAQASPLGLVADAVQRLGHEWHARLSEAETASARWAALGEATWDTAIVTTDTDGDIQSFSTGASRLLGWEPDEVLARPAAVLFKEESYKDLLPMLARDTLRRQGVTARSTLARRDGTSFPAEVSVRMIGGSAAHPAGFLLLARDISAQVRMEHELRDSEQRYRGLVEGLSEGVLIVRGGEVAYANPAAHALTGIPARALAGTPWRDRVATADVLVVQDTLQAVEDGRIEEQELTCRLIGAGRAVRAEVRLRAKRVDLAEGPAVLLLVRDETAERAVERELRRNEARLDAVIEATSDGILVLSEDGAGPVARMTNAAFARMVGLALDEVLGATEAELLERLRARGAGAEAIAARIGAAADHAGGTLTVGRDRPREVLVEVARLSGRSGERLGRVVVCRDLTEQKLSERRLQEQAEQLQLGKVELEQSYRKLHEVNRQLQARSEELDRLNQELRKLDEMKSALLGNVSHELQTPLVSIRGYTEMILKERLGPISDEQRKGLGLSLKNIDRLISMIDNLLAFSRSDPALGELKLVPFGLRALVQEARDLLRERILAKGLDVAVSIEGGDLSIRADRDRILQVFLNLLSNAVKFNREGGRIVVTARHSGAGHAAVSVRDTGVGIPAEALGRIFDRHYQVHRAPSDRREGSGIGLAIVREILRLHGCTIEARSEEGLGAEFAFTLPLGGDDEPERDEHRPDWPAAEAPLSAAGAPPAQTAPSAPPQGRARLRIIRPGDPGARGRGR
jgi:PAS domain S-box-containing protein